jgi:hypothetical protein
MVLSRIFWGRLLAAKAARRQSLENPDFSGLEKSIRRITKILFNVNYGLAEVCLACYYKWY